MNSLEENLSKELEFLNRKCIKMKGISIVPSGIASTNGQRMAYIEINKEDFFRLFSGDTCRISNDRSFQVWERFGLDGVIFRCQEYKITASAPVVEELILK